MHAIPRPETFDVSTSQHDLKIQAWEQHNAETLVGLTCQVPADVPFRAREINLQLDRLHLARVQGTAHTVVRDDSMVSSRPEDAIVVYAALRGEAIWEHAGSRRVVSPGQLLVCDVDRPFLRGFGHGLEELAVKVPRDAFTELTGMATVASPLFLDAAGAEADPYARALVRVVGRSVGRSAVPADERTILELVSVLATGGRVKLSVAHRAAARAFIDDHLADPTLTAADVAAGAGISERQLSRLFADAGTSIPQHILARRLDLAHTMLRRPDKRALRIADIAASCGFTSTSYFADVFKQRFDMTAGAVRRSAQPYPGAQRG